MKHLKLFFACLLMAVLSIGQVWAAVESVTISPTQALNDGGVDPITIACAKGDGTSNPAISSGQLRLYQAASGKTTGNTITFSSTYSITSIVFTFNGSNTASNGVFSEGDYDADSKTWSGSTNSLTLTCTGTTSGKRIYIEGMTVYYETGGGTQTCATPTFSPAAGSYEGTQNVTISSTAGATIYYTTDGTTPSTTSNVYSSPIAVSADMTIKAYAVKAEYDDSEVATAAYEITEGPDVTIAFEGNTDWDIPAGSSNKTVAEGTYTDGTYTIKIAGSTGEGYYINGYLLLGKTGAYVELPEFSNPVEKIVVVGTSGGSTGVKFNIYDGTTAVSTEVTGCKNVSQEFEIADPAANKAYKVQVTSNANLQISAIKIFFGEAPAVAKPTISGDESFVGSTTVTISHADADHIYYTTDGTTPTNESTEYTAAFTVDAAETTVKAIAVKGSDVSEVASKTFTKVTPMTTAAALRTFATSSNQNAFIQLDGWKVTFVNGNNAYLVDPDNEGVILNNASHGYVAGDELNDEAVEATIKLSSGRVQLTGFTSSNITATAGTVSPAEITDFSTLTSANQSRLVTLKEATYASSTGTFSDGEHVIYYYDQFNASPTLVDGTTYDVTGVVIYYDNGSSTQKVQIAPRTAADVEAQTPVVIPTAANLAALKAAARGTYILTLTNAVISYVNGKNAFIEDATGGALIFFQDHGFTAGDCLNGDYQVVTTDYQGKFEITAIEPQAGAATSTAAIPLTTVSIATLNANFSSYESRRIKIEGANVTDAITTSDRNGAINDGAALAVYAAVASTITLTADDNVDIIGYPGFHNTDQQLNVWRQEDITVNVKDPAGIAFDPASATITAGDAWSAPDFANPNSLDVTFSSDDESVATVSNAGVVALAGGYGTAVITAHTDGDATHASSTVTYTITVNDPGATPVYTMSFDMTRASYDAAADAQVVWNSSVVTMTVDKNDGTKVTNYLAGNYSGTTLIAETRLYAKNSISFVPQSGVTITKIEWMSTAKGYATKLAAETFVNATAVVDGTDDKLVIITPSAAGEISVTLTDAARATNVKVYYEAESEKAKLTASIAIANINTSVGAEDILLSDIAATSNPNKNAISYAITSGTAVSLVGEGKDAAFHVVEEGTATITATIPNDLGNYTGASTTFNIVVAAAPATLESIAISGTASVLEYTEGQDFNPAGLVVTGTYSDASTAPISEGITWAYDPSPLTLGTTSVSVTATVSEISSSAFVVYGLTVSAAPVPTSGNIVILAEYNSKFYAMTNSLTSGALAGVEVEKDGSKIVVSSAEDKAAIQWTATVDGDNTTLKDGDDYYIKGSNGASLSLEADPYNWNWDGEKSCYISSAYTNRGLFFSNSGNVFKGYALSNITSDGYAATEVIEIDPEDIVISSKVDPALAYTPASDEITVGDAWSAPVLVNPYSVTITSYNSDNESVATVDGGVIALAGGIGTAVITAHFDGNASYLEGDAVYTITVNAPAPTPSGTTYRKVTATEDITDGEYLIVYEDESVAFNGNLTTLDAAHNTVSVVISEGVIAGSTEIDNAVFTIDVANGTLRAHMGDYIGVTSYGNGLKQNANAETYPAHSFSIDGDGNAVISLNDSWTAAMILNYNKATSDKRFRYYKSASPQQPIQLYKKETAPEPDYEDVRTGLTAGNYYTICYNKEMTAIKGASLWELDSKDATFAYLTQATAPYAAGKPYIVYAESNKLEAVLEGDAVEESAIVANGALHGTFSLMNQGNLDSKGDDIYLVIGNELRRATGLGQTGNTLPAYRAYVVLSEIPSGAPAPGKKVRKMPMQGQTTTGCELINAAEAPAKMMINGQLFILRGEKKYDATGRLVK